MSRLKHLLSNEGIDMMPELYSDAEVSLLQSKKTYNQWTISGSDAFIPANPTVEKLAAGLYSIEESDRFGPFLKKLEFNTSDLVKFPQSNVDLIFQDIKKFWSLEEEYKKLKQLYKRGILLVGASGGGKSSSLNLVIKDLIANDGIVIKLDSPPRYSKFMHIFRQIEPTRNVLVIIEDIDGLIDAWDESSILNILDGMDQLQNVVYLATTNYPEKLLGRITNRPSRFDRVFEFDYPDKNVRKIYLESLAKEGKMTQKDIDTWVEDTENLTVAHIKELYVSVNLFGYNYDDTLKTLKGMKKVLKSKDSAGSGVMGFK